MLVIKQFMGKKYMMTESFIIRTSLKSNLMSFTFLLLEILFALVLGQKMSECKHTNFLHKLVLIYSSTRSLVSKHLLFQFRTVSISLLFLQHIIFVLLFPSFSFLL